MPFSSCAYSCFLLSSPTRRSSDLRQRAEDHQPAVPAATDPDGLRRDPPLHRSRSEEHTSELQSLRHLVCLFLLAPTRAFYSLPLHAALPISGNEQKITSLLFQQQLILTVYGVIRLYTDLVALVEDEKVDRKSVV